MADVILQQIDADSLIEKTALRTAQLFFSKFEPKPTEKKLLTKQETAELLSVNLSTIHNWVKNGKLNPKGIGGRVYFDRDEVLNSIKSLK